MDDTFVSSLADSIRNDSMVETQIATVHKSLLHL